MPELPEVEVVRRGLADHVVGHRFTTVDVLHPRSVRTDPTLAHHLPGLVAVEACRRGKYLWLPLSDSTDAEPTVPPLAIHLRMSGQILVLSSPEPVSVHTRIIAGLDNDTWVHFVDQRTFGWWAMAEVSDSVAPDLLEVSGALSVSGVLGEAASTSAGGVEGLAHSLKRRHGALKAALLDQHIVSGIGNIYADEMLWRAQLHPLQDPSRVSERRLIELLLAGCTVMEEAIAAGGTSFDSLYVNVNGNSGYFSRSLSAYGRAGRPCHRCGTEMVSTRVAGRSAVYCPVCQRRY